MRILAVIDDDMYFRNFIVSGSFGKLLQYKNFKISPSNLCKQFINTIPINRLTSRYIRNEHNKKLVAVYNRIAMKNYRKKSSTLDLKTKKSRYSPKDYLVYTFFSLPPFFPLAKKIILNKFKMNLSLEKVLKKNKPDLVLFPISGYEGTAVDLVLLSKKYNFKTFFLTNGWDNLSSKGILLLLPDYIGVWGPQSLVHAFQIQGMKPEKCFLLGCARYESYFNKKAKSGKYFPFKYIVYAGTQTPHNEIKHLKSFERLLEKNKKLKVKIIYRPHPNRGKRKSEDYFVQEEYKHIIIDPQVAKDYYENKKLGLEMDTSQNFPKLDYNAGLLNHALFLISPLSSLIIEAGIMDVPSLIIANKDDENPMSPADHAQWTHFQGANEVPGWYIAKTIPEGEKLFLHMLKKFNFDNPKKRYFRGVLSESIKKYLFFDHHTYSERLENVSKMILETIKPGL